MPPAIFEPVHFEQEDRARLYFKVHDLLPPDGDAHGEINHGGMLRLEESLKRVLGRLTLATGHTEQKRIETFIVSAPERELLDLIELVPATRRAAHLQFFSGRGFGRADPDAIQLKACAELNSFLEITSSPARFNSHGVLVRDPFVPVVTLALSKLPKQEELRRDVELRCADDSPTALIFIDLDNFKQVNDTFGHLAGDQCLTSVAEVLGRVSAMRAKVYRYGGDEFAVVLPNCTTAEASVTAERIRFEIDQANVGGEIKVTVIVGVVATDRVGHLAADLVDKADQAMYSSKQSGRNKVTGFEP